ncbi:unnamed protein product [Brachionus calyciflorus]|uniref:F-box domain-containing protein n=1 Tax=Brachionus calyciflorus TaxID=104777 RepID=A0A813M2W6_9BILA|nr:unnamed protein product [Brachionus calyciflorus]
MDSKKDIFHKIELNLDYFIGYLVQKAEQIQTNKDKLSFLIHLLISRERFSFKQNQNEPQVDYNLHKIQKDEIYFTKIFYNHFQNDQIEYLFDSNIIITLLKSGRFIEIQLKYKNYLSNFYKINLDEMFLDLNTKKLKLFELNFKNVILIPFKFYLKSMFDINTGITGLTDLPIELIIHLSLKYLDIKSIVSLSQTCRYFCKLLNPDLDRTIPFWEKLIMRDFKVYIGHKEVSHNYKQEYTRLHKSTKKFKLYRYY